MEGDAHPQRDFGGPGFREERLLKNAGGGEGVGGASEDGEEAVPFPALFQQQTLVLLDDGRGQRIVAFVVLTASGSVERLTRYCAIELPRYMQPARFEVRDALPRLASGKHDLAALR